MNSSNMKHLVIHSCFPIMVRPGDKSELIPILKRLAKESKVPSDLPGVDGLVIKKAVIVNQLKSEKGQSFALYAGGTVHPYLKSYQKKLVQSELIWSMTHTWKKPSRE